MATTEGPIDELWSSLERQEITKEHAAELAAAPDVTEALTLSYIEALCETAESLAVESWERAVDLHRLTLAAVEAALERTEATPDAQALANAAWGTWLEVVTRALIEVPDGRLMRSAVAAGERFVAAAEAAHDLEETWLALHRLGVLHLDPYTANRSNLDFDAQTRAWKQQRLVYLGAEELAKIPVEELEVDEPLDALTKAQAYLERAAGMRAAPRRGLSLKALGNAMEWRISLGAVVDRQELVQVLREALDNLDRTRYPREYIAVLSALDRHGESPSDDLIEALYRSPLPAYAQTLGLKAATEMGVQIFTLIRDHDPERALQFSARLRPLLAAEGGSAEAASVFLWTAELAVLFEEPRRQIKGDTPPLEKLASKLKRQAARDRWDGEKLGLYLAFAAYRSPAHDEELSGLELLREAMSAAPDLAGRFADTFAFLTGSLYQGAAVNAIDAGKLTEAAVHYLDALSQFLALRLRRRCWDLLLRVDDLTQRAGPEIVLEVLFRLAKFQLWLEQVVGQRVNELVQQIYRQLGALLVRDERVELEPMLLLHQGAKGLRFSAMLSSGTARRWKLDPPAIRLLERIADLKSWSWPETTGREETWILAAYIESAEALAGTSPEQVAENRRRSFDDYIVSQLVADTPISAVELLTSDQVQALLDARTVLLSYIIGRTEAGDVSLIILALTRETASGAVGRLAFPSGIIQADDGIRKLSLHPLGVTMQSLFKGILADPDASTAAEALEQDYAAFIGGLDDFLARQRSAGKDHLCVVPHGPLHFYPFHLLRKGGRALGEDWIVTYLACVSQVAQRNARASGERTDGVTSIGLGFADSARPIPQAVEEARAIADLFGSVPILEASATKERLKGEIGRRRYVHIASHGGHSYAAPAFDWLALAPDAAGAEPAKGDDGILFAYELLGVDLEQVEVVSLSACETALGRFDRTDDLRGFSASCFLDGAATVLGTLWQVETNVSAFFFRRFYELLRNGRSRLDAFAQAQREARAKFPANRDWGAFYLTGAWS